MESQVQSLVHVLKHGSSTCPRTAGLAENGHRHPFGEQNFHWHTRGYSYLWDRITNFLHETARGRVHDQVFTGHAEDRVFRIKTATGSTLQWLGFPIESLGRWSLPPWPYFKKIYVMRYLTGVSDEKLREKFLKETEPTIKAQDKITQHKVAASSVQSMGGRINASKVVPTLNRSQKCIPSTGDLVGRCTHCSDDDHPPSGCPQKSSTCHGCKTTGHLLKVCQKIQLGKAKPGKFPPEQWPELQPRQLKITMITYHIRVTPLMKRLQNAMQS